VSLTLPSRETWRFNQSLERFTVTSRGRDYIKRELDQPTKEFYFCMEMFTEMPDSIHNRGLCGHIEEVSIAKEQQGKHFGQKMLAALDSVAINLGCYKTILDCSTDKEPFYVKCQYHNSGTEMSHYYEEPKEPYYRG
jgi:hypothetical protein